MFFFHRAFRGFFLGGSVFATMAMLLWGLNYPQASLVFSGLDAPVWHGHEMIFGYALATVTGFLLTAAMNWTGSHLASGNRLAMLFALWLFARLGYLLDLPLSWIAFADMGFVIGLFLLFSVPVIQSKQWNQLGLAAKFLLLAMANGAFYADALGWISVHQYSILLASLFLILAIDLTMIRRVLPFFTEKALGIAARPSYRWLDVLALAGFLILLPALLIAPFHLATAVLSLALALIHALRWVHWYHPKIWGQLLLWPLFVSYGFMVFGLFLWSAAALHWVASTVALHALAAGGIGLLCSAIMARISLGHTGRNVFRPPPVLKWVFALLVMAAFARVVLPILWPEPYVLWMHLAQAGWVLAFLLLSLVYAPILARPDPKKEGSAHKIRL